MMNRELYIDGKKIDLPDNVNFNLVWQCAKPGELKIYGSGSSTVKLPFTPANDAVFQRSRFVNVMTDAVFATFDARYYENNMLMFSDGKATLLSVSDSYEVALTWGNTDYIQKLKDTPIYTLSLGAFKWDDSHMYPMAETSGDSQNLPALYTDGNQALMFRHALSRPLVYYSSLLAQVGITLDNAPSDIMTRCGLSFVQVNSTNAYGNANSSFSFLNEYVQTMAHTGIIEGQAGENAYLRCAKVASFEISEAGLYSIKQKGIFDSIVYDEWATSTYYKRMCLWITPIDYGDRVDISKGGISPFIKQAFMDDRGLSYNAMYANGNEIEVVALAYIDEGAKDLSMFSVLDWASVDIEFDKGTYHVYLCNAGNTDRVEIWDDQEDGIVEKSDFSTTVKLSDTTVFVTGKFRQDYQMKITSPDDPILSVNPPDMVTMLGYETAYEVVEDFMKLFPLMVVNKDGRFVYFSFKDVRDNKADAYDWSDGFVGVDSVAFGNDSLASLNHVRYATSDGYKGLRADGSFTAKGAKAEQGDYAQLSKLTSYEDSKNMRFKPTPNSTINSTIPVYPLAEVEYDKDSDTYAVAGTKDTPCLLFQLGSLQIYNAKGEDGKTYRMFKVYNRQDTMNNIINTYWRDFIEVCGSQRTVTIKAVLHARHLSGFDFRRPVYFKQLALYIFVQKITYKGHAESTIEGIII